MKRLIHIEIALALASQTVLADDRKIRPLPGDQCHALADTLGKAMAIPPTIKTGTPAFPTGVNGDACLLSGTTTGLVVDFSAAQHRLDRAIAG
ncbi:hypothetical protein BH11PSE3_BH11PSE3_13490 [soil metagenome]